MSGICEEINSGLSNVLHFPRSPRQPVASRVSKTGKSHDLRWSCLCFLPLWGKPFWGPKNTSHSLKKICNSINSIASLIEQAAGSRYRFVSAASGNRRKVQILGHSSSASRFARSYLVRKDTTKSLTSRTLLPFDSWSGLQFDSCCILFPDLVGHMWFLWLLSQMQSCWGCKFHALSHMP